MFNGYRRMEIPAPGSTGAEDIANVSKFPLISQILETEADNLNFNAADVISKLKQAKRESDTDKDNCVCFALEDSNGGVAKVWVPREQEKEFHDALASALASSKKNFETEQDETDIAEVLFGLKDKFDIVSVTWLEIPEEDEEATTPLTPPADTAPATDAADVNSELDSIDAAPAPAEPSSNDLITKLIDMIKSQADADKAKAKAETAKAAKDVALHKMKQEEQMLDMDNFNDEAKTRKKEADKLIQLARFKQEMAAKNSL